MAIDGDSLRRFLINLPHTMGFENPVAIRHNLYKALYYCCSSNGQYLPQLFPDISDQEIDQLHNLDFPITTVVETKNFFDRKSSSSRYSHPSDKACARPLLPGEPVFRCLQCGFDDTCVLCVHCYNKLDHVGHDVTIYTSKGIGGLCDCGDPEAFTKLNCKCRSDTDSEVKFDSEALRQTIEICLDYVLDVTYFSISTLPMIHARINQTHSNLTTKKLSEMATLPSERYGGGHDTNSDDLWYLLLWNDEFHNYIEAMSSITRVTDVNESIAQDVADHINKYGRAVLKEASTYEELLRPQNLAETLGLTCSICSARDFMKEEIVTNIFNWLNEICSFKANSQFREMSKSIFAEVLLKPGFKFSKVITTEELKEATFDDQRQGFENGLLHGSNILNVGYFDIKPDTTAKTLSFRCVTPLPTDEHRDSRLQYLLIFQTRFPKILRKLLPNLIIVPIVSDIELKQVFTDQLVSIYPNLITAHAFSDREEDLNLLGEITAQIFTCPNSVQHVLKTGQFKNIIGPVTLLIFSNCTSPNKISGFPTLVQIENEEFPTEYYRAVMSTVLRGLRDVSYFTDKSFSSTFMSTLLEDDNLFRILLLLCCFQGHSPIERKYGDHVERDHSEFLALLTYTFPVLKMCKSIGTLEPTKDSVQNAVSNIIVFLHERLRHAKERINSDYQVSKDPVAIVHPIHTLLSFLFQSNDFSYFEDILKNSENPFTIISDVSLRSIVFGSQVRVGFWVRNGIRVSRQASIYFDRLLNDLTYYRDIHLNQVGVLCEDPKTIVHNFLNRWELLDWFLGNKSHDETIYEERFFSISERFIVFLYHIITDRSFFVKYSTEECLKQKAKKEISYSLCTGPKTYTKLKYSLNPETSQLPEFDSILHKVATFTAPTGLVDSGTYRLKPKVLEKLDPLSLYLDASEFLTVHEVLVKCLAENNSIPEDKIVLKTRIIECQNEFVNQNIGNFAKSKDFAKLIYKFLQVAIDTSDETYLAQLLQLIDAVLVDDELLHGKDYLCENFVAIPICDLLLTIVESTLSKHIVNKADYLLEQFILKDRHVVENLVDCFGEEYVSTYKKRKTGLYETEAEVKKRKAEERKAKVLKKFAEQREVFMNKNKEFENQNDVANQTVANNSNSYSKPSCVLCGESEDADKPIGVLVSATTTTTFWTLPSTADSSVCQAFEQWGLEKNKNNDSISGDFHHEKSSKYSNTEKLTLSTCGHCIHYECYKESSANHRQYPCPLCHNLHDFFLPTFTPPKTGGGLDESDFNGAQINVQYNAITNATNEVKTDLLVQKMIHEDYLHLTDANAKSYCKILSEELLKSTHTIRYLSGLKETEKYFNYLTNISVIIADTIRMHEIATRYEGSEEAANLLSQIPGSVKTLLRSLIQSRALLYKFRSNKLLLGSSYDMKNEIELFYNSDQVIDGTFAEVISLFFQTDESFSTLCRWGLVKLITITVYYLISCSNQNSKYVDFLMRNKAQNIGPDVLSSFSSIIDSIAAAIDTDYNSENEEFVKSLYESVSKVAYIYLRQMVIFKDLLSAADKGDNTFVSNDLLSQLPDKMDFEVSTQICNPLTDILEIPSLDSLFSKISPNGSDLGCENSWFDIILCAKIPRYSPKIFTIDYPGVVHLIDLPKDYSTCVAHMESMSATPTYDSLICLHCGKKIKWKKRRLGGSESVHPQHMQFCYKRTGLFFHPVENIIKICIFISQNPIVHEIPGPYLTIHGETKTPTNPGKGTLNKCRYDSLNRLWLNQGLYGFVTRSKFGTWVGGLGGLGLDDDFGVTRVTLDDDLNFGSSDEEMEDIEEFF